MINLKLKIIYIINFSLIECNYYFFLKKKSGNLGWLWGGVLRRIWRWVLAGLRICNGVFEDPSLKFEGAFSVQN